MEIFHLLFTWVSVRVCRWWWKAGMRYTEYIVCEKVKDLTIKSSRDQCANVCVCIERRVERRRRNATSATGMWGAVAKKSSGGQPFVTGRQIVIRQDKPAEIRVSDNEKWNIIIFYSGGGGSGRGRPSPARNKAPRAGSVDTRNKKEKVKRNNIKKYTKRIFTYYTKGKTKTPAKVDGAERGGRRRRKKFKWGDPTATLTATFAGIYII